MPDAPRADEIYVGYLPVPPRQRRFLRWGVPTMLWVLCGICYVWTSSQKAPEPASWNSGRPIALRGSILATPYPMVLTVSGQGAPEFVLFVEVGKIGSQQRAAAFDGRRGIISGWPLERDGRRIIELEPGAEGISLDVDQPEEMAIPRAEPLGRVKLRGEIVDSKCFFGAMKPGEGKTHKECATLCIRGGIPPMLITRGKAGTPVYYLLQGPDGQPVDPAILPFIADPVEVSGDLSAWANLMVLTIRPEDVRRL